MILWWLSKPFLFSFLFSLSLSLSPIFLQCLLNHGSEKSFQFHAVILWWLLKLFLFFFTLLQYLLNRGPEKSFHAVKLWWLLKPLFCCDIYLIMVVKSPFCFIL